MYNLYSLVIMSRSFSTNHLESDPYVVSYISLSKTKSLLVSSSSETVNKRHTWTCVMTWMDSKQEDNLQGIHYFSHTVNLFL